MGTNPLIIFGGKKSIWLSRAKRYNLKKNWAKIELHRDAYVEPQTGGNGAINQPYICPRRVGHVYITCQDSWTSWFSKMTPDVCLSGHGLMIPTRNQIQNSWALCLFSAAHWRRRAKTLFLMLKLSTFTRCKSYDSLLLKIIDLTYWTECIYGNHIVYITIRQSVKILSFL